MIINKLVFPIKADLSFVEGALPQGKLTANNLNRDILYVLSPTVSNTVITVSLQNDLQSEEVVKVELLPSDLKISDLVDKTASYYNLVKDWGVWQGILPSKPFEYVAYNRSGKIGISFNFRQYLVPHLPAGVTYRGEIKTQETEPTSNGVYVVKIPYYTYEEQDFFYNDLLIKNGETITRKPAIVTGGSTATVSYSVDPSVYRDGYEEIDITLTELILSKLGELDGDISMLELAVENVYTKEETDNLLEETYNDAVAYTEQYTYDKDTIDQKDADTLQLAKDYTYDKDTIDDKVQGAKDYTYPKATIDSKDAQVLLDSKAYADGKLDKNFGILTEQTVLNLTDVLVLNRGNVPYRTSLTNLLARMGGGDLFIVVNELPETGLPNKIYLVPKAEIELYELDDNEWERTEAESENENELDEYIWIDNDWERIGGVSVDLSNYYNKDQVDGLLANKLDKNASITGATKTKITYDEKGLVTGGSDLTETDIPTLPATKITQTSTARFVTDTEKTTWNNKVDKNNAITGAKKTKITYDSKGLVTAGEDLTEADIPQLPASKITYDNSTSGLVAENVKDAIDETVDILEDTINLVDTKVVNKLDKVFSSLVEQTTINLTDVFVLNRGGVAYRTTLANMLTNVNQGSIFKVVSILPSNPEPADINKIFLVPTEDPEMPNYYEEYIWVDYTVGWEKIGGVSINLDDYYTKNQTDTLLGYKQNTLTAGDGINITSNVISAVGEITVEVWNTATKTIALSDKNKLFRCSHTSDQTLTIPTNTTVAFPIGTMITFLLTGTNKVIFSGVSGVTLTSMDNLVELATQYAMVSIIKTDTNTWQLVGALE